MRLLAWAIDKAGTTDAGQDHRGAEDGRRHEEWLAGPISFTDKNTLARSNFIVLEGKDGAWARADEG